MLALALALDASADPGSGAYYRELFEPGRYVGAQACVRLPRDFRAPDGTAYAYIGFSLDGAGSTEVGIGWNENVSLFEFFYTWHDAATGRRVSDAPREFSYFFHAGDRACFSVRASGGKIQFKIDPDETEILDPPVTGPGSSWREHWRTTPPPPEPLPFFAGSTDRLQLRRVTAIAHDGYGGQNLGEWEVLWQDAKLIARDGSLVPMTSERYARKPMMNPAGAASTRPVADGLRVTLFGR